MVSSNINFHHCSTRQIQIRGSHTTFHDRKDARLVHEGWGIDYHYKLSWHVESHTTEFRCLEFTIRLLSTDFLCHRGHHIFKAPFESGLISPATV